MKMNSILILVFVGGGVLYRNGDDEGLSRMVLRIGIFNHRKKREKGRRTFFLEQR